MVAFWGQRGRNRALGFLFLDPILWRRQMDPRSSRDGGTGRQRGAAAFALLAIAFLLLVPDPHDHGDASSLGGLFQPLLPSSIPITGAQQTGAKPRPGPQQICPIHLWHQVAASILLLALLLRFFLNAEVRPFPFILLPSSTGLRSFHNRAPPILL